MNEHSSGIASIADETTDAGGVDGVSFEPLDILAKLKTKATGPSSADRPPHLPLASIVLEPRLFQPRGEDERHIQDLVRAIKSRGHIEPVTVVQVGNDAVLVDGHHRIAAYGFAKVTSAIPVSYFEGTLEEAVLEAGNANSKAKLPMSNGERQDFAWRLVLMGTFSKRQIQDAAGVSDGQVGTMRRARKTLGDDAFSHRSWWQAQQRAKGVEPNFLSEEEEEQRLEELAQRYADRLSKAFGSKLPNNPEVAARAFSIHFGRRLRDLASAIRDHVSDFEVDEDSDF